MSFWSIRLPAKRSRSSPRAVPASWRPWYLLNPMAGIVSSFRDILLRQAAPDPEPLRIAAIVTAVALPLAYLFFKRAEATMADAL